MFVVFTPSFVEMLSNISSHHNAKNLYYSLSWDGYLPIIIMKREKNLLITQIVHMWKCWDIEDNTFICCYF